MKFSISAIIGAAISVTLLAPSVQACERECQQNVSRAFADKYEVISNYYYGFLNENIENSLFWGVPKASYSKAEAESSLVTLQTAVDEARKAWNTKIYTNVFDSIFKDEPKFKGDCNHPKRVIQPPLGVWWKPEDCHQMDYICGNPPSICHFMPMIKKRIRIKFIDMLQLSVDGDESDVYANYIGPALDKIITDHAKLAPYKPTLHANLNQILDVLRGTFEDFASNKQWKREWDEEIKQLLLTFP
ncbi:hypothetical protein BGZ73_003077 [Actinomortierella ambigua]|nr:hypothetical protein BGZ73_003077 [Actinomortierella ambigua]